MANHFTPEELAQEMGTDTRDVIQLCVKEGIPIYKGKIDRSLLTAVMKAKGIQLPKTQVAGGLATATLGGSSSRAGSSRRPARSPASCGLRRSAEP